MSFRVVIPRGAGSPAMRIAAGGAAAMADGSCVASRGGTVVHASAIWRRAAGYNVADDGTPLIVEFRHRASASGLIAPNFAKRDSNRPSEAEVLGARALDRALRPRFKSDTALYEKIHVTCTVHASDGLYDPIALAANACSAALELSDVPWNGPVGTVRVGCNKGVWTIDPTLANLGKGGFDLLYAGANTEQVPSALMMELGCAAKYKDEQLADALRHAHAASIELVEAQSELARHCRIGSTEDDHHVLLEALEVARSVAKEWHPKFVALFQGKKQDGNASDGPMDKKSRGRAQAMLSGEATDAARLAITAPNEGTGLEDLAARRGVEKVMRSAFAEAALTSRVDGRLPSELRPLTVETDVLPTSGPGDSHGSSRFTRGETDVMASLVLDAPPKQRVVELDNDPLSAFQEHQSYRRTATLPKSRQQGVSVLAGDNEPPTALERRFILHYEFPSHATSAAAAMVSANRRAVGHGALAERALAAVFPTREKFPYTVRVSADVLSSNGSSSMATVVAASLALFDAGVPMTEAVAGVSVGCVGTVNGTTAGLLVDLNGTEDHYGDMDFKISGTREFVTALQLDVKPTDGVPLTVLEEALGLAKTARGQVLDAMSEERVVEAEISDDELVSEYTGFIVQPIDREGQIKVPSKGLSKPRESLRLNAPRVEVVKFNPERLTDLLGRSGGTLRELEARHRCKVETQGADGELTVFARAAEDASSAHKDVLELVADVELGAELVGTVAAVREYGSVIKVLRDREGVLHCSETHGAPDDAEILMVGQVIRVRVIGVDPILGHIKLSRKGLPKRSLTDATYSSKEKADQSPSSSSSL